MLFVIHFIIPAIFNFPIAFAMPRPRSGNMEKATLEEEIIAIFAACYKTRPREAATEQTTNTNCYNMIFKQYKQQYAQNLRLALPVVLGQAGQIAVQLADNIMVGRLGATSLAGAAFANTIFFMVFIFGVGISLGITPLVGEHFARDQKSSCAGFFQNAMLLYTIMGLLLYALSVAIIPLMYRMGQPAEVVEIAVPYYRYIALSIIPFMIFASFRQFLEGIGNTKVAMTIVIVSNLLNIGLNYILIHGKLGAPAMGAAGAGLSTLISRSITPVMMALWFWMRKEFRYYWSLFERKSFSCASMLKLLKIGIPISIQLVLEASSFCVATIMAGWIGTIALASTQVAIVISNIAYMVVLGVSAATTIRISHEYGRGDWVAMRLAAKASYHICLAWNTLAALLLIGLRGLLPAIFTDDAQVIATTANLLIFVAIFQLSDGLQGISMGILRGIQDVRITIRISFISYVLISITSSYLLAFTFGLGAEGIWCGFILGLASAAVMLIARWRKSYNRLCSTTPSIESLPDGNASSGSAGV